MASPSSISLNTLNAAIVRLQSLRVRGDDGWHDPAARAAWFAIYDETDAPPSAVYEAPWKAVRNLHLKSEFGKFASVNNNQGLLDFINEAIAVSEGQKVVAAAGLDPDEAVDVAVARTANVSTVFACLLRGAGLDESSRDAFFKIITDLHKTPRDLFSVFHHASQLCTAIAAGSPSAADPVVLNPASVDRTFVDVYGTRPVAFLSNALAVNKVDVREIPDDALTYFLLATGRGVVNESHTSMTFESMELPLGQFYEVADSKLAAIAVGRISRQCGYSYLHKPISREALQIASLLLTVYSAEKNGTRLVVKPLKEAIARTEVWKHVNHPKKEAIKDIEISLALPMQRLAERIATHGKIHNLVTSPGLAHISYLRAVIQDFLEDGSLPNVKAWRNAITGLEGIYAEAVAAWDKALMTFSTQFPNHDGKYLYSIFKTLARAPFSKTHELFNFIQQKLAPRKAELIKAGQQATVFYKKPNLSTLVKIIDESTVPLIYQSAKSGRPVPIDSIDPGTLRTCLKESRAKIRIAEVDKNVDGKRSGNSTIHQSLLTDEEVPGTVLVNAINVNRDWNDVMCEIQDVHPALDEMLKKGGDAKVMVWEVNKDFHIGNAFAKAYNWSTVDFVNRLSVDGAGDVCPPVCSCSSVPSVLKPGEFQDQILFFGRHVDIDNVPGDSGLDQSRPQTSYIDRLIGAGPRALVFRAVLSAEWNDMEEGGSTAPAPLRKFIKYFKNVSFIPGQRAHNGVFYVVASNRRDVPATKAEEDVVARRAKFEWDAFSVRYGIFMYRANALKNLATVLGITAPHIKCKLARDHFEHYTRPCDYVSRHPGWEDWNLAAVQVARINEIVDEDRSKVLIVDGEKEDAEDDWDAIMAALTDGVRTPITPAPRRQEVIIDELRDPEEDAQQVPQQPQENQ